MTDQSALPTREEMFLRALDELSVAYKALGDAADWLRSDWTPAGSSLTDAQGVARSSMFDSIGKAKAAINEAKSAGDRVV
jgi:hypothetical protein